MKDLEEVILGRSAKTEPGNLGIPQCANCTFGFALSRGPE